MSGPAGATDVDLELVSHHLPGRGGALTGWIGTVLPLTGDTFLRLDPDAGWQLCDGPADDRWWTYGYDLPRYLWDPGAAAGLRTVVGVLDRCPFFEVDGTQRGRDELDEPDTGADPVRRVERAMARQDDGAHRGAWSDAGLTLDRSALAHEPVLKHIALHRISAASEGRPRRGDGSVVLACHPQWLLVLDGDTAAVVPNDDGFGHDGPWWWIHPGWRRLDDLDLLRAGRRTAADLHPLILDALFPSGVPLQPSVPVLCDGRMHSIGRRDGYLETWAHGESEPRGTRCRQLVDEFVTVWQDLDRRQDRLLLRAAQVGSERLVAALLAAGVDPDVRSGTGNTPLLAAAAGGHAAVVALLAATDADATAATEYGQTALHLAAEHGRRDVAAALLAHGADPDVPSDHYDATPLMVAAYRGYSDIVELLLDAGADPGASDRRGQTALHAAAGAEPAAGFVYADRRVGSTAAARTLLARGAQVDQIDDRGWTALHVASANGRAATVQSLLAAGASVDVHTVHGLTPLDIAHSRQHADVVSILRATGAPG